jgi:hypothetical protein
MHDPARPRCTPPPLLAPLLALLGLLWLLSAPATAQLVKCAGDGSRVIYQDTPCPAGRELRNFDHDPATLSIIPLRPVPGTTTRVAAPVAVKPRGGGGTDKRQPARRGDPAERKYLHLGMHEGEVLARAGSPDRKSSGGRKRARWTYMPAPADAQTITTVLFEEGKVIEVERKVVK